MRAVLLALLLLPTLASATDVRGTISTSTVWTRRGSPYVLQGDVTVAWGTRLTLEPGVRVIAAPSDALKSGVDPRRVELIVDGTLVVRGTAASPVELTSHGGDGAWYGIRVRGGRGTEINGAVITQAHQGISLDMSAAVRNTSVSAVTEDCIHVSWGTATLAGNELSGCGRRAPDARVSHLSPQEGHTPRVAALQHPHPGEPTLRGRRVFMMAGQGTRSGVLAARVPRLHEALPSNPTPLARRLPETASTVLVRSTGDASTRIATLRPAADTAGSFRPRPWSPPGPPDPTEPTLLFSGSGSSATGPPAREECARVPGRETCSPHLRRDRTAMSAELPSSPASQAGMRRHNRARRHPPLEEAVSWTPPCRGSAAADAGRSCETWSPPWSS